jgi:hypothetical protein
MSGNSPERAQEVEEARGILRRLGTKRFGTPSIQAVRKVNAIEDIDRLEYLIYRLLDLESWDDLLDEA